MNHSPFGAHAPLTLIVVVTFMAKSALAAEKRAPEPAPEPTIGERTERAILAFHDGHMDVAGPLLEALVEENAPTQRLYLYRGLMLRKQKSYPEAIAVFERGLRHPGDLEHILQLEVAVTLSWSSRIPEAIAAYERVLVHQKHFTPARVGLARMHFWNGNHERAVELYRDVLRDHPHHREALLGVAEVHRARFRGDEARAIYDRLTDMDDDDRAATYGLRKLDTIRQFRADAALSYANMAGTVHAIGGRGQLSFMPNPDLTLSAGYGLETFQDDLTDTPSVAPQHRATASVAWRASERWTVIGEWIGSFCPGGCARQGVGLGLAYKVHDQVVLNAAIRPDFAVDPDTPHTLTSRLGMEVLLPKGLSVSLTGFSGTDFADADSYAVAAGLRFEHEHIVLSGTGAWSVGPLGQAGSGAVSAAIPLTEQLQLTLSYELFGGPFTRHGVNSGVSVTF